VEVELVDRCEGCAVHDLDFSPSAFAQLGAMESGRLYGMTVSQINHRDGLITFFHKTDLLKRSISIILLVGLGINLSGALCRSSIILGFHITIKTAQFLHSRQSKAAQFLHSKRQTKNGHKTTAVQCPRLSCYYQFYSYFGLSCLIAYMYLFTLLQYCFYMYLWILCN
jgi:hypothetical protein